MNKNKHGHYLGRQYIRFDADVKYTIGIYLYVNENNHDEAIGRKHSKKLGKFPL